jgi:DNA-binding response OmpR family regulator
MRLAIIEDDPEITEVVSIAFETAWPSSQIVSAPNAVEGLEMIKNESPDVVILDVALPEGDSSGFDLCKEIRTFSEIPIIMVTARTLEVDIVRGLELGAADYLTKPFSSVELLAPNPCRAPQSTGRSSGRPEPPLRKQGTLRRLRQPGGSGPRRAGQTYAYRI